jgi:large subunit ribosomal protein L18
MRGKPYFKDKRKLGEPKSMGFKRVDKRQRRFKKKRMIRKKVYGTTERPRLVVFRSLKNIYGQLVDDTIKKTITTVSSRSKELQEQLASLPDKSQSARIVGKALAAKALSLNIKRVVFDRNGYLYHGRVKALAEGAREGGLMF